MITKDKESDIKKLNILIKEASIKAINLKEKTMNKHFEKINLIVASAKSKSHNARMQ